MERAWQTSKKGVICAFLIGNFYILVDNSRKMSVRMIDRSCSRMTLYLSRYKWHSHETKQCWRAFKYASNEPWQNDNTCVIYEQFKFQNEPWKVTIRDFLKIFGLRIAINNLRRKSSRKSVRRGKLFFYSHYFCVNLGKLSSCDSLISHRCS